MKKLRTVAMIVFTTLNLLSGSQKMETFTVQNNQVLTTKTA